MRKMVTELIEYRHLLYMLTWREIKIRYKQTIMGFLWAIFMPLIIITAGILVKKAFSILSGRPMTMAELVSVSVKALPWAFFVGSIRFATHSLTSSHNLITKIYFPREILPLSSVLAQLFDFGIAAVALSALFPLTGIGVSPYLLWLPVLLLLLILLTAGLGMLLSCANLFFRDVKYIVEVVLTFGIFFTPVFYDATMFGDWKHLLLLNPLASLLEAINDVVVLHRPPDYGWVLYAACCAVIGFVTTWTMFDRAEPSFAENI